MRLLKRWWAGLLCFLALSGCNKEQPLNPAYDQNFVVQGILVAGKRIDRVHIYEWIPYADGLSSDSLKGIENAEIMISTHDQDIQLEPIPGCPGYYHDRQHRFNVSPGDSLYLRVNAKGTTVHSRTVVPPVPEIEQGPDTLRFAGESLSWYDEKNQSVLRWSGSYDPWGLYYVVITPHGRDKLPWYGAHYSSPLPYEGDSFYERWSFDSYAITLKHLDYRGRYTAYVYRVNREYALMDDPLLRVWQEVTKAPGNIENGYGLFTAVSMDSLDFVVEYFAEQNDH
jgi:hypothetical protein